jgi:hypothetical protein
VAAQEGRAPDDRLTHISTVLRYPSSPRLITDRDPARRLRLRLEPAVAERAREVSLRLPGQSQRGHHDYQARLLTDAVVTAIAVQSSFTDEVLEGLRPVLRHRAAAGLWGLAVAATSTGAEREVYAAAEQLPSRAVARSAEMDPVAVAGRYRSQLVAEVLREDVGWHDHWRFQVVAHLAGQLLCGEEADRNEQMLYDQHVMVWGQLRHDLENSVDGDHRLLDGLEGFHQDLEGRGGTAVWRAERVVELQDFENWIMGRAGEAGSTQWVVTPPGWTVEQPDGWCAYVFPPGAGPVGEPWESHLAAGRVLRFKARGREVLWPVARPADAGTLQPVPGMEAVIGAVRNLGDADVIKFVESLLVRLDLGHEDQSELLDPVRVPLHKARQLGLIDPETHQRVLAETRAERRALMKWTIERLPPSRSFHRAQLGEAMGNAQLFARVAKRLKLPFKLTPAAWVWPVRSVADEVGRGTGPEALEWLASWAYGACRRGLERSMERAWHAAFERHHPEGAAGV